MTKSKFNTKQLVLAALCVALGVVLPVAFHSIPNAGSVLLPMHIPVLLCGLVCGPVYGLLSGILTPLLSSMITGMPPMAYLPSMLCELAAYGLAAGVLRRFVRTGKRPLDLYIQLVSAMLIGRLVYGVMNALIFSAGNYSFAVFVSGAFVTALPGIVPVVFFLNKADLPTADAAGTLAAVRARLGADVLACGPDFCAADIGEALAEELAARDETLMEDYLVRGYDAQAARERGAALVRAGLVCPAVVGAALNGTGVAVSGAKVQKQVFFAEGVGRASAPQRECGLPGKGRDCVLQGERAAGIQRRKKRAAGRSGAWHAVRRRRSGPGDARGCCGGGCPAGYAARTAAAAFRPGIGRAGASAPPPAGAAA